MSLRLLCALFFSILFSGQVSAQINAGILAYPDISNDHIVFAYADDLWIMARAGGPAHRLSTPPGGESFPRFSPDGKTIVYSANYNGNYSLYSIPVAGGLPVRLTWHSNADLALDWSPDGQRILFSSDRESGSNRYSRFFTIPAAGGLPSSRAIPFGEFASWSPDGKQLAFTTKSTVFSTWKRYRGGLATDIYLYDLTTNTSENITDHAANDELPMWYKDRIYFLSDRGPEMKANLWVYDLKTKTTRQITTFTEVDVRFPGMGQDAIVFTAGEHLVVLDLNPEATRVVPVQVVTDLSAKMPRTIQVSDYMQHFEVSPDGQRAVLEARGEIFSVPKEHGPVINLTSSSASAERYPAWSPDGRKVAWWTDRSGNYELAIQELSTGEEKIVTHLGPGYRYQPYWSPDSKLIVYIDQTMAIHLLNTLTQEDRIIDRQHFFMHGALEGFTVSWSPDSRWVTYARDQVSRAQQLVIYDTRLNKAHAVTSGYYTDGSPSFDPEGKYLYFVTNREFTPAYSDFDNSWVYTNSSRIGVITLQDSTLSLLVARNDTVALSPQVELKSKKEQEKKKKSDDAKEESADEIASVLIDFDNIERRIELLPLAPGNYASVIGAKGKVLFLQRPNTGAVEKEGILKFWDSENREEKTIISGIDWFLLTANGEKIIVLKEGKLYPIEPAPDQELKTPFRSEGMTMELDPPAEWRQLFNEVWRLQRDFFYDKNMHGVDWSAMHAKYAKLVDVCATRSDLNFVIGELIGELNASHTYRGGGDLISAPQKPVGFLGMDWAVSGSHYAVGKILRGAIWDTEVRSPLDQPGIHIKEGDLILAVNGVPLTLDREPSAAFAGLADKEVILTIAAPGQGLKTREVIVRTLASESRLRELQWIEEQRLYVDKASGGRVGYIYVPNTGVDGQNELMRQFSGQWDKDALLIDERWNSGGQIPDRFIELLNRKPLAFWAIRDGETWRWPPVGHFGPKAMLINGWSGSGGDAFPDYFRKSGLGPLIGTRTWGGLIGISGAPQLIDNGFISVPTFRMYNPDGSWFKEGHGVDPDFVVPEDPGAIARGSDPQIDRALVYLLEQLDQARPVIPPRPADEKR
ncbi:MAG: PD40 domain-containing protein [Saprospiraceae bacterium]|nr:PD40 domain-containing protein [Saprospiraceae bacterium]